MSRFHAVAFVDHESAHIQQFGKEPVEGSHFAVHHKFTRQHHSGVRSTHEFYGQVCDALDGIVEVLLVGGHTGLADFRRYVNKRRPQTATHIADYQVVDHPSEAEMVALARAYFNGHDKMTGTRLPPGD
jgi:hypothetical protein